VDANRRSFSLTDFWNERVVLTFAADGKKNPDFEFPEKDRKVVVEAQRRENRYYYFDSEMLKVEMVAIANKMEQQKNEVDDKAAFDPRVGRLTTRVQFEARHGGRSVQPVVIGKDFQVLSRGESSKAAEERALAARERAKAEKERTIAANERNDAAQARATQAEQNAKAADERAIAAEGRAKVDQQRANEHVNAGQERATIIELLLAFRAQKAADPGLTPEEFMKSNDPVVAKIPPVLDDLI